jgi:hypothetical protein
LGDALIADETLPMNMSSTASHPSFPQPPDASILAWRYMDLPKLLALIVKRELYLRRLDLMPDKFEGLFPSKMSTALEAAYSAALGPTDAKGIAEMMVGNARLHRKRLYVSCWHLGNVESEAMWRIYCGAGGGAAIVLPYKKLSASIIASSNALPNHAYLGVVRYLDYDTDLMDPRNLFNAALHKRRQFAYEQEARIAKLWVDPAATAPDQEPPSISIPWDIGVVDRIVVSPYAGEWYVETVRAVVERLAPGLGAKVVHSPMAQDPT